MSKNEAKQDHKKEALTHVNPFDMADRIASLAISDLAIKFEQQLRDIIQKLIVLRSRIDEAIDVREYASETFKKWEPLLREQLAITANRGDMPIKEPILNCIAKSGQGFFGPEPVWLAYNFNMLDTDDDTTDTIKKSARGNNVLASASEETFAKRIDALKKYDRIRHSARDKLHLLCEDGTSGFSIMQYCALVLISRDRGRIPTTEISLTAEGPDSKEAIRIQISRKIPDEEMTKSALRVMSLVNEACELLPQALDLGEKLTDSDDMETTVRNQITRTILGQSDVGQGILEYVKTVQNNVITGKALLLNQPADPLPSLTLGEEEKE